MKAILTLFFLLFGTLAYSQENPDIIFDKTISYKLKDKGKGKYELSSYTEVSRIVLSERAAEVRHFYTSEPYYVSVSKLKSKCGKKSSDYFYHDTNEREFISANKQRVLYFSDRINVGDTIKYSYKKKYIDPAYIPITIIPNSNYVRRFSLIFEHPKAVTVDFEFFFPRGEIPFRLERLEKKTTLEFDSLGHYDDLPYFAYDYFIAAILTTFKKDSLAINPTSVKDFVAWFNNEIKVDAILDTMVVDFIPDSVKSDSDKLSYIYNFVRDSIRYLFIDEGGHSFLPHDPDSVIRLKYGDCKDKAYLMLAMAAQAGIKLSLVATTSEPNSPFDGVNIGMYNHVICCYENDGECHFYDPTARPSSYEHIMELLIGHDALIIDTENPRKIRIPETTEIPAINVDINAHIDSLDRGTAIITCRGEFQQNVIKALGDLIDNDLELYLAELISKQLYKTQLSNFTPVAFAEDAAVLMAEVNLSEFIIQSNEKKYVPQSAFIAQYSGVLERLVDSLHIYFKSRMELNMQLSLTAPGFKGHDDSTVVGDKFTGYYSACFHAGDSSIFIFDYTFMRPKKFMEGSIRNAYLEFYREYKVVRPKLFVLERTEL